jgi:hypothetical protein
VLPQPAARFESTLKIEPDRRVLRAKAARARKPAEIERFEGDHFVHIRIRFEQRRIQWRMSRQAAVESCA